MKPRKPPTFIVKSLFLAMLPLCPQNKAHFSQQLHNFQRHGASVGFKR